MSVTDSCFLSQKVFFMIQKVCVCHILSVSVIYSLCLSQTFWFAHKLSVSATDSLCLSQAVCFVIDNLCVSKKVFACKSESLSGTLLVNSWTDFYLFIHDFHQDLSVRFEYVQNLCTKGINFVALAPFPASSPTCLPDLASPLFFFIEGPPL